MKNFKLLPILILLVTFFVAGCGGRTSPAADLTTFCNAMLKSDDAALQKIGVSQSEYQKMISEEFTNQLSGIGLDISDAQLKNFSDALFSTFKKANYTITDVSQDRDNAVVEVTVDVFNELSEEELLKHFSVENLLTMQSEKEVTDAMVKALSNAINNMTVVGTESFKVDCIYNSEKNMWIPKNANAFGEKIVETMFSRTKF